MTVHHCLVFSLSCLMWRHGGDEDKSVAEIKSYLLVVQLEKLLHEEWVTQRKAGWRRNKDEEGFLSRDPKMQQ